MVNKAVEARESRATAVRHERHPHGGGWLREVVFGLNDGLVTTLVFIMTVSAVASPTALVVIALGEVCAGGVAMAMGGWLSGRTDHQIIEHRIATEHHEILQEPDEERAELRAIYRRKGLRGALLDRVVAHLTADHDRWLHALVTDELGVVEESRTPPWRSGALIGVAFVVGGLIPALPFLLSLPQARLRAYGLTALTALLLGALKSRYTESGPVRAGLEFLLIVTAGAVAGALIGAVLKAL